MVNIRKILLSFIFASTIIYFNTTDVFSKESVINNKNTNVTELVNSADRFMDELIGSKAPGAAVVIVKDGEVILSKGYGYADLNNKVPVDPDKTVFEYGSISKLFVWTSVMQLVEEKKIKLDDDIKNYLPPDVATKLKYKHPITMLDLMSHTGGFEEQPFDWLPFYPGGKITSLEQYLTKHQPTQVYKPGEIIAYSNYGVALAGLVVKYVSGEEFCDYEANHIFNPLNMDMASGNPLLADEPEIYQEKSKGYLPAGDSEFIEGLWTYLPEYPAGSVNGTIRDLGRFLLALTPEESSNTPLFQDRSTLDMMLSQSYTPTPGMSSNAHGFWEHEADARYLYHPGETASFTGMIAFSPEKRYGFAILSNAAEANDLVYGLSELLLRNGERPPNQYQNDELPDVNTLSGDYLLSISCYNSIFEIITHLTNRVRVRVSGANELSVEIGGQTLEYAQISPYFFTLKSTRDPVLSFMDRHLYFETQNGNVKRISTGNMDMVPLRSGRSAVLLWLSILFYVASLIYFIAAPIVLLIVLIRSKLIDRSNKFSKQLRLITAFTISGTILLINNSYIVFLVVTDIMRDWHRYRLHIMINWALLFAIIILGSYSLHKTNSFDSKRKLRCFASINFIITAVVLTLLFNWHFFNITI